jgi:hypothetical protein
MFDSTITIFNRYSSSELGDTWYPHVLKNVQLIKDKASIKEKYGAESTDSALLIVNSELIDGEHYIDGLHYLSPKKWQNQVNDDIPNSITFNDNAELFDFFIVGEWEGTEPISDDDYRAGFFSYMNKQYDYCYAITSVGDYKTIPHFKIIAR